MGLSSPEGYRSCPWTSFSALFLGHEAWTGTEEVEKASSWVSPNLKTVRNGKYTINTPPGQSYEIRLLENRKLGDFQDLNTKYVKVSLAGALPP